MNTETTKIVISVKDIENGFAAMLRDNPVLTDSVEACVEFLRPFCGFNLDELVFRTAVRCGAVYYVEEHADDVNLNDRSGHSSYFAETDSEEMKELLWEMGAARQKKDLSHCRFLMEEVSGSIVKYDLSFQQEVFKEFMAENCLTEKLLVSLYEARGGLDDIDISLEDNLYAIGVDVSETGIAYRDLTGDDGDDLKDILEDLGWLCEYEGPADSDSIDGYYYIE